MGVCIVDSGMNRSPGRNSDLCRVSPRYGCRHVYSLWCRCEEGHRHHEVPLCGDSRPNRVITQHHKPQASDRPLRERTRTRRRSATPLSASTAPAELGDDIHTWLRFSGHCRPYLSATAACRSSTGGGRVASDERISQKKSPFAARSIGVRTVALRSPRDRGNEHGLDSLLDNGGPKRSLGVPICRYVGNDSVIHSASQSAFGC